LDCNKRLSNIYICTTQHSNFADLSDLTCKSQAN